MSTSTPNPGPAPVAAPAAAPAPSLILTPAEMTQLAVDSATGKATSHPLKSFLLAITAGLFIGVGFAFFVTSQMGAEKLPVGVAKVLGGFVFSTGLAMVVLTGAELFTSSTLTLTAKAAGKISWLQLLRNWGVVYVGNFLGSLLLAGLMWFGGTWESNKGAWGAVLLKTADYKCSHTFVEALVLGILCNIMVCMAVWLTYAGRTATDKILALTLPITMFVATGFEHSVANMFLIPFGLIVKGNAPAEFWTTAGIKPESLTHLTWDGFFVNNLLPVTLGNIIGGGIMIGLYYYLIFHLPVGKGHAPHPAETSHVKDVPLTKHGK